MAKKRRIIGEPRQHTAPVTNWQLYENELARRQYSDPVDIAVRIEKKQHRIINPSRCEGQIRKHGGTVISTEFGKTSTPTLSELAVDYKRRIRQVVGVLGGGLGAAVYHDEFEDALDIGGTPELIEIAEAGRDVLRKLYNVSVKLGRQNGLLKS